MLSMITAHITHYHQHSSQDRLPQNHKRLCQKSHPIKNNATWRFMGSYKWGYSPLIGVVSIVTLLVTPLLTTHDSPSKGPRLYSLAAQEAIGGMGNACSYSRPSHPPDTESRKCLELDVRSHVRVPCAPVWVPYNYRSLQEECLLLLRIIALMGGCMAMGGTPSLLKARQGSACPAKMLGSGFGFRLVGHGRTVGIRSHARCN